MLEQKSKTINGIEFRFMPLHATPARDQLDQLIHKFGPSVASALEGLEKVENLKISMDDDKLELIKVLSGCIAGAVRSFCGALQPGFHKNIVDTFLSRVEFMNSDGNFQYLKHDVRELLFATDLLLETRVLIWCLEVQYADFFELFRTATASSLSSLTDPRVPNSESQQDSIGASIE